MQKKSKLDDKNTIKHLGIVKTMESGVVTVSFLQETACSTCHVNGVCSVPEGKDQEVDINDTSDNYEIGESVNVIMQESMGVKALFLGYILPFIIVMIVLVVSTMLLHNDLKAGLISLACLIPYYLLLYYKRDQLKKTFAFKIQKINS